ncbi:hypothetical protein ABBQ32_006504 [Trebouxia sp. C0010 RCD-2024]
MAADVGQRMHTTPSSGAAAMAAPTKILATMKAAATKCRGGRTKPHEPPQESTQRGAVAGPKKQVTEGVQQQKRKPVKAQAVNSAPKRGRPSKCNGKKQPASPAYMDSDESEREQYSSEDEPISE